MANIQGLSAANMTPCTPSMDAAREALSTYFGYEAFRQGQEVLIGAVLSGRDALGIMPTGATTELLVLTKMFLATESPKAGDESGEVWYNEYYEKQYEKVVTAVWMSFDSSPLTVMFVPET